VISAQKANTANSFSLPGLALSTANLYAAVQPGGTLYGLQHSNPVDTVVAYRGPASNFGQEDDPMVGHRIGGVNVFGGGLALYILRAAHRGFGVSGDTSCADHNISWRTRHNTESRLRAARRERPQRRQHQLSDARFQCLVCERLLPPDLQDCGRGCCVRDQRGAAGRSKKWFTEPDTRHAGTRAACVIARRSTSDEADRAGALRLVKGRFFSWHERP